MKSPVRPSRVKQIERTMAAMMSTITAPRHGAHRLGPVMPIVMVEMIAEAGAPRLMSAFGGRPDIDRRLVQMPRTLMTHSGHRPDRNPAAQRAPGAGWI